MITGSPTLSLSDRRDDLAVTATSLYHVGVLVRRLGEGMDHFGDLLGLTFRELDIHDLTETAPGGPAVERSLRVAMSQEGPPFLELIEATPDGVWGHHHGEGLHHIGSWEEHLLNRLADLRDQRVEPESLVSIGGELVAAYLAPRSSFGTRIELVQRRPGGAPSAPR